MALKSAQPVFSLNHLKRMKQRVLLLFEADWLIHLLDLRQRSHSFGNQSESSCGGGVSETEMNVPETEFLPLKIIQGDYYEK